MQDNTTEEYRWTITRHLTQFKYAQWPPPLNVIQLPASGLYLIYMVVNDLQWESEGETFSPGTRINQYNLYSGIVQSYFEQSLGDNYDKYVLPEAFDETYKEELDEVELEYDDSENKKLTKGQTQTTKTLLKGIAGEVNLVWILRESVRYNEKDELGQTKNDRSDTRKLPLVDSGKRQLAETKKAVVSKADTEIRLTLEADRISGQGNDKNGPFYWDGTYLFLGEEGNDVKWVVRLSKRYIGRYAINYEGQYSSKDSPIIFKGTSRDGGTEKQFELFVKPHLEVLTE